MNLTLSELCKNIDNPYNHILEFGVHTGSSLITLRNSTSSDYSLYGFDSFEGLPEDWKGTNLKKGDFSLNGNIPEAIKNLPNCTIYKGWFKNTIKEYLKIANDIAILHIDCDLYSSTIDILFSGIKKYIKDGTYIVFDEWYYNFENTEQNRQHEQKAFYEWATINSIQYELLKPIEPERQIIKIIKI